MWVPFPGGAGSSIWFAAVSPPMTVQSYHQSYEGRPVTPGGLGGAVHALPPAANKDPWKEQRTATWWKKPWDLNHSPKKSMYGIIYLHFFLKFAAKSIGKNIPYMEHMELNTSWFRFRDPEISWLNMIPICICSNINKYNIYIYICLDTWDDPPSGKGCTPSGK